MFDDIIDAVADISWSDVWDVGKVLIPVAANIAGNVASSNANQSATDAAITATNAQADQLQLGYDEQLEQRLAALEQARGKLDARSTAVLDILRSAQSTYAGDVRAAAGAYIQRVPAAAQVLGDLLVGNSEQIGQRMRQAAVVAGDEFRAAAGDFGTDVIGAAGRFQTDVTGAADRTRSEIIGSTAPLEEMLSPYSDAGRETLAQMRRIAFSDPTRMTDAQRILLDDNREQMGTRLAGSGLRGSGAGIAAAMQEEGRLRADLVEQNRRRSDGFLNTINTQGFAAANTIGSAKAKALIEAAGVGWEAAKLGATAVMQAEQMAAKAEMEARGTAAKLGLDAEKYASDAAIAAFRDSISMQWGAQQKAAQVELDAGKSIADNAYGTAGKMTGEIGNYYDQAARYDLSTGDAIGSAALAKREAEARSLGPVAALQGANEIADAKLWGQGIGAVTRIIADERSMTTRPGAYSDTMGGGSMGGGNDTVGYNDWGYL